jgi:hypothetical protein
MQPTLQEIESGGASENLAYPPPEADGLIEKDHKQEMLKSERGEGMNHPEQQADEILWGNVRDDDFRYINWRTKRLGQAASMGGPSGSQLKPVFIKRHEVEQELSNETDQSLRRHYQTLLAKERVSEISRVLGEISRGTTAAEPERIWADTIGRAREMAAKTEAAGLDFPKPAFYLVEGLKEIAGIDLKGFPNASEWAAFIDNNENSYLGSILRDIATYDLQGLPNIAELASHIAKDALIDVYGHKEYEGYREEAEKYLRAFNRELAQALREIQTSETLVGARDRAGEMLSDLEQRVEREEQSPEIGSRDFEVRYLRDYPDAKIMISALNKVAFDDLGLGEAKIIAGQALAEANAKWNPFLEKADVGSQLRRIAAMESIGADGPRYSWRDFVEMAFEVVNKAHTSDVYWRPRLSPEESEALRRISNVELLCDEQYSSKDKALMIRDIAREAFATTDANDITRVKNGRESPPAQ